MVMRGPTYQMMAGVGNRENCTMMITGQTTKLKLLFRIVGG